MHPAALNCQSVSTCKSGKMLKIAVVFLAIIVAVLGACDTPKPIANFDKKQYTGLWYIHTVAGQPVIPVNPCFMVDISGDKYTMKLTSKDGSGKIKTIIAEEISSDGAAFKISAVGKTLLFTVLDTDYKTYASVHVCDTGDQNQLLSVTLRSPKVDASLISEELDAAQKMLSSPVSGRTDSDFSGC
ncbi:unnamed protein product [Callosobruchus maculatus]|uniref:Lipocalin/cytosolic fatty-acid binding domain-containing protein n=1 Tax=Callosobruchus maculatus TaxID=64391 RepID=A0A653C6M5_CALMS|nr:unnamed protein product [Callosobruchus maculatus]